MAHFAKISEENEVINVLTVDDKDTMDNNNQEIESIGQSYLETHNNWPAHLWIKTSYNTLQNTHRLGGTPFRGNYAGIGYIWDPQNNIFLPPKPFPSWVKNIEEARWQSPIGDPPQLTEEQQNQYDSGTHDWIYLWDENNQTWNLINLFE